MMVVMMYCVERVARPRQIRTNGNAYKYGDMSLRRQTAARPATPAVGAAPTRLSFVLTTGQLQQQRELSVASSFGQLNLGTPTNAWSEEAEKERRILELVEEDGKRGKGSNEARTEEDLKDYFLDGWQALAADPAATPEQKAYAKRKVTQWKSALARLKKKDSDKTTQWSAMKNSLRTEREAYKRGKKAMVDDLEEEKDLQAIYDRLMAEQAANPPPVKNNQDKRSTILLEQADTEGSMTFAVLSLIANSPQSAKIYPKAASFLRANPEVRAMLYA